MSDNVDYAVDLLTEKISKVLNEMAPVKKIQCRAKYAPWISDSTKKKIKKRNAAQKRALDTNDNNDWEQYRRLRNSINNILKSEKRSW